MIRHCGSTRRDFLRGLTASLLLPVSWKRGRRLPIAFSTLGCPDWDWKTILATASRWGFPALELRGLEGELDLTQHPQFQGKSARQSVRDLKALSLRIIGLGTSLSFHEPDPSLLDRTLEEGKRWIDLAHRLQAPFIRVFGDRLVAGEPRWATIARITEGLQRLTENARGSGVAVLLESHGDFTQSASLAEILEKLDPSASGLLWDTHHTFVSGAEEPAFTFAQLGKWVRHTHIKDSVADGEGRRYVLTGGGSVPLEGIVRALASGGYTGYYCFEWEKVWHPEIEDAETAFPHYASVMSQYLKEAGVPEIYD